MMVHVPLDAGESVVGAWRLVNRRFCLRACRCLAEVERVANLVKPLVAGPDLDEEFRDRCDPGVAPSRWRARPVHIAAVVLVVGIQHDAIGLGHNLDVPVRGSGMG